MRDQFSRLLEDSGLVPSTNSGGAVNNFSGNMELVKVRNAHYAYSFRRFLAYYKMALFFSFSVLQKTDKQTNNQNAKDLNYLFNIVVEPRTHI